MSEVDSGVATKADLKEGLSSLAAELRAELASKADLEQLRKDMMLNVDGWGMRLELELARHAKAITEEIRSDIRAFDDKLDAHIADTSVHKRARRAR